MTKPNIFFLEIDSFNSDKCYGPKKSAITPNIDSLINNGIFFKTTITSAPQTAPAIASLFTSMYPFQSLLLQNNVFTLNPNLENYVEGLKNYGYNVHAMVPTTFTHYRLTEPFGNNVEIIEKPYEKDSEHHAKILKNIKENLEEPWFYYVHLLDLHTIITKDSKSSNRIPDDFNDDQFGKNPYDKMLSALDNWIGKLLNNLDLENTIFILTADHGSDISRYDEFTAKRKSQMKSLEPGTLFKFGSKLSKKSPKFLNSFKEKYKDKYLEKKLTQREEKRNLEIEEIENKNISPYEKRFLKNSIDNTSQTFDDRFVIPLIMAGNNLPKSIIISNQIRTIDIFPTLFEIIGAPMLNSKNHGKNLLPLINGDLQKEEIAFLTSGMNSISQKTDDTIALRTSEFKYMRNKDNCENDVRLFNLKDDPFEENNIAENNPELVKRMEEKLQEFEEEFDFRYVSSENEPEEDEIREAEEELKKLGYL